MKILQLGKQDLKHEITLRQETKWVFCKPSDLEALLMPYTKKGVPKGEKPKRFDFVAVFITSDLTADELAPIMPFLDAYRVIIFNDLKLDTLAKRYCAYKINRSQLADMVKDVEQNFFMNQYGDNRLIDQMEVTRNFNGKISYNGRHELQLEGDLGTELSPLISYRVGFLLGKNGGIELWPVFEKSEGIELKVVANLSYMGAIEEFKTLEFSEEDLKKPLVIDGYDQDVNVALNIWAKGKGTLRWGNINQRLTRHQYGTLIMGGKRFADKKRQEFFYYYNPGNLKPPLNVYFAGWQRRTGFEGYFMMRNMKHPFLLIADPRLEGGSFYLGSDEYEQKLTSVIKDALAKLNFTPDQLVLAGLSMGTTGAIYYGSKIGAKAIIVGKPLINLGSIALNNKLHRSNAFDTSLDILLKYEKSVDKKAALDLNAKMIKALKNSKLKSGQLRIAYMKEDDYDENAFHDLIENLSDDNVKIVGKGYTGRHNDDSISINRWFINQYRTVLDEFEGE